MENKQLLKQKDIWKMWNMNIFEPIGITLLSSVDASDWRVHCAFKPKKQQIYHKMYQTTLTK